MGGGGGRIPPAEILENCDAGCGPVESCPHHDSGYNGHKSMNCKGGRQPALEKYAETGAPAVSGRGLLQFVNRAFPFFAVKGIFFKNLRISGTYCGEKKGFSLV